MVYQSGSLIPFDGISSRNTIHGNLPFLRDRENPALSQGCYCRLIIKAQNVVSMVYHSKIDKEGAIDISGRRFHIYEQSKFRK